jgi:predicted enzyme related to lactoylglutathione lyase
MPDPLLRKIDCLRIPVRDLDAALGFYRDRLGHALNWRSDVAAGLSMPDTDAELVLYTDGEHAETDLLVENVASAVARFVDAGGTVVRPPFDITVGKCALVRDPFGNVLVLLDLTRGRLQTDPEGNVAGVG